MQFDGIIVSTELNSCRVMENSPVIRPTDHEIRENRSGIHRIQRLRMKKRILVFTRRGRRVTTSNNNILPSNAPRYGAIEQQLKWIPSCHTVLKCLIPSLFGFVAVKCQAKSEDPCITHPLQTWSFLSAIFVYSLVLLALRQLKNHQDKYMEILDAVALACGVLSTFSLLSILLPDFPGLVLLYASWALSTAIAASPPLQSTYNWLLKGVNPLPISHARNLLTGWNFSQQEPPLPPSRGPPA